MNYEEKRENKLLSAIDKNEEGMLELNGDNASAYMPENKALRLILSYDIEQEVAEDKEESERLESVFYRFLSGEWKEKKKDSLSYPRLRSDGHFAARQVWPGEHRVSLEGEELTETVAAANKYLEQLGLEEIDYKVEDVNLVEKNPRGQRKTVQAFEN